MNPARAHRSGFGRAWVRRSRALGVIGVSTLALAFVPGCSDGAPNAEEPSNPVLGMPATSGAVDELFVAIDATRSVPTGRYATTSPKRSTIGSYDPGGVSLWAAGRPEIRVTGSRVYLPSELFPTVGAATAWLTVPLDNLAPLENRSPGLADEVAALAGTSPPGIGPALAALRTATQAANPKQGPLRAELNLSDLDAVAPRDQDAVVAWAGLWARDGGTRQVVADVSIASTGRIEQVVFDPDGDTPAGPHTLTMIELGAPVSVNTPLASSTTPLR